MPLSITPLSYGLTVLTLTLSQYKVETAVLPTYNRTLKDLAPLGGLQLKAVVLQDPTTAGIRPSTLLKYCVPLPSAVL